MRRADLVLGIAAPIVTYRCSPHSVRPTALAWGALFPLAGVLLGIVRERRVDVLAALSLGAIAVSLAGGLLLHSATFLLVKESLVTRVIGLGFLGSVLARHPLPVVLLRGRPGAAEAIEARRRIRGSVGRCGGSRSCGGARCSPRRACASSWPCSCHRGC
ncbi:hypothetical protein GCM10023215_48870 [Pseudonocardia yuanmonensis]|uniref:Uncharacterized protein n=1 Tax=Pseudonocardia yuanmonensis TaxID=1095914 RepID=A0ABP8XAH2_9PSEU